MGRVSTFFENDKKQTKYTYYYNKKGVLVKARKDKFNEPKMVFKPTHRDPKERMLRNDRSFKFDEIQEWVICSFYETVGGRHFKNVIMKIVENIRKYKSIFWQKEFHEASFRNTLVSNLCRRWTRRRDDRKLFGGNPTKTRKNCDLVIWTLYDNKYRDTYSSDKEKIKARELHNKEVIEKTLQEFNQKHQCITYSHVAEIIQKSFVPYVFKQTVAENQRIPEIMTSTVPDDWFEFNVELAKCYKIAQAKESYTNEYAFVSFETFKREAIVQLKKIAQEKEEEEDDEDFWNGLTKVN